MDVAKSNVIKVNLLHTMGISYTSYITRSIEYSK